MDPLDPDPDGQRDGLVDGFCRILASQPLAKNVLVDYHFVKLAEVPNITLSSLASKYKAISLHERGLVVHFTSLFPSPCSIEI